MLFKSSLLYIKQGILLPKFTIVHIYLFTYLFVYLMYSFRLHIILRYAIHILLKYANCVCAGFNIIIIYYPKKR